MQVEASLRVLVVDDDADTLETVRDVLALHRCESEAALSVPAAITVLERGFQPDVILLDLVLGRGERGEQLVLRLRGDARFREIPIIAISADPRRLQQCGADAGLLKPFGIPDLLDSMRRLVPAKK